MFLLGHGAIKVGQGAIELVEPSSVNAAFTVGRQAAPVGEMNPCASGAAKSNRTVNIGVAIMVRVMSVNGKSGPGGTHDSPLAHESPLLMSLNPESGPHSTPCMRLSVASPNLRSICHTPLPSFAQIRVASVKQGEAVDR